MSPQSESEPVYVLTQAEREAIEIGLEDVRKGLVFSSEEANEILRQWLKRDHEENTFPLSD